VAATSGRVVAFLAADCVAAPGWVQGRITAHAAGHAVVASAVANGRRRHPAAWAQHFAMYARRSPGRPAGVVAHPDPAAHGLSFDRAVLERTGPFDEHLRVGEDTAMAKRLAELGVPVWFEPGIETVVFPEGGPLSMMRDRRRRERTWLVQHWSTTSPWGIGVRGVLRATVRRTRTTIADAWRYGDARPWVVAAAPLIAIDYAAASVASFRWRRRNSPRRATQQDSPRDVGGAAGLHDDG
jgi:hypothetical protein